jgi:DNA repair exonuclease SbcCD ATPase subunit
MSYLYLNKNMEKKDTNKEHIKEYINKEDIKEDIYKEDIKEDIDKVNLGDLNIVISSFNSPELWFEYLSEKLDENIIGNYNWKNLLINPENLLINKEDTYIPLSLHSKIDDKNKKMWTHILKYIDTKDNINTKSSNLNLIFIEWSWILCFGKRCWFNFDKINGVALLNAKNGYGKSSFLEIICLALFGEGIPSRSSKNSSSIICQSKPKKEHSYVKLMFELDDNKYCIQRYFLYNTTDSYKLQTRKIELFRVKENNILESFKSGTIATNKWITENVGNISSFLLSSLLSQNSDYDFFSMKYNDQINILDKSLSLDTINILIEVFKQSKLTYKNIIENLENIINDSYNNIKRVDKREVEEKEEEYNNLKNMIEESQNSIMEKSSEINSIISLDNIKDTTLSLTNIKETLTKLQNEKETIISDINIVKKDISYLLNNLEEYNDNILLSFFEETKINIKTYLNYDKILGINESYINSLNYNSYNQLNEKLYELEKELLKIINDDMNLLNKKDIESFKNPSYYSAHYNIFLSRVKDITKWFENYDNIKDIYRDDNYDKKVEELEIEKSEITKKIRNMNSLLFKNHKEKNKLQKPYTNYTNYKSLGKDECIFKIEELNILFLDYKNKKDSYFKKKEISEKYDKFTLQLINIRKEIKKLINSIKEVKEQSKDYPYNPDCECCRKQPWKLHLNNLEDKLEKIKIEKKELNEKLCILLNVDEKISLNDENIKLKEEIKELEKWLNNYELLNDNKEYFERMIIFYNDINKIDKDIKDIGQDILDNERKLEILDKDIINAKNFEENNKKYIMMKENLNKMQTDRENLKDYELYYNKCREYHQIFYKKMKYEKTKVKFIIDGNIQLKDIKDDLNYWNKLYKVKPKMDEYENDMKRLKMRTDLFSKVSGQYISLKSEYKKYEEIKDRNNKIDETITKLKNYQNIYIHISELFSDYRIWLYKEKILPIIKENVNMIIRNLMGNEELGIGYSFKGDTFIFNLQNGENNPLIEKASGFQRFICGLAMRIVLSKLGISSIKSEQLFIDEGFSSCDNDNLLRVPDFLSSLIYNDLYKNIVVVSHLKQIKDSATIEINIDRNIQKGLSSIKYGYYLELNK